MFTFSPKILCQIFQITRIRDRDIIIIVHRFSGQGPVNLLRFE